MTLGKWNEVGKMLGDWSASVLSKKENLKYKEKLFLITKWNQYIQNYEKSSLSKLVTKRNELSHTKMIINNEQKDILSAMLYNCITELKDWFSIFKIVQVPEFSILDNLNLYFFMGYITIKFI